MLKDEISRAVRAYLLRCRRNGNIPVQPCAALSERERREDGNYVVLRNSYKVLAAYRVSQSTGRLIYVPA